jgi:hypothetical protein
MVAQQIQERLRLWQRQRRPPSRPQHRLVLEQLEDRSTPSVTPLANDFLVHAYLTTSQQVWANGPPVASQIAALDPAAGRLISLLSQHLLHLTETATLDLLPAWDARAAVRVSLSSSPAATLAIGLGSTNPQQGEGSQDTSSLTVTLSSDNELSLKHPQTSIKADTTGSASAATPAAPSLSSSSPPPSTGMAAHGDALVSVSLGRPTAPASSGNSGTSTGLVLSSASQEANGAAVPIVPALPFPSALSSASAAENDSLKVLVAGSVPLADFNVAGLQEPAAKVAPTAAGSPELAPAPSPVTTLVIPLLPGGSGSYLSSASAQAPLRPELFLAYRVAPDIGSERASETETADDAVFLSSPALSVGHVLFSGHGAAWLLVLLAAVPLLRQLHPLEVLFAWDTQKQRDLLGPSEEGAEEESLQALFG